MFFHNISHDINQSKGLQRRNSTVIKYKTPRIHDLQEDLTISAENEKKPKKNLESSYN